jgi:hypothetical protein
MKKSAVPLLAACALLLGQPGAAQQVAPLATNCTSTDAANPCKVVITMSAGCGSGIKVAPDPVVVPRRTEVHIQWEIQAQGWQFEGAGIEIHFGEKNFSVVDSGPKKRKFRNRNVDSGAFKYDVVLTGPGGVCRLDPTIINQ